MNDNLEAVENKVMSELKDFQKATVERIAMLFQENKQNRILVADEVGLGKTLIARGVIAKTATIRQNEGDDIFRVAYVCSNANIAEQNLKKLQIFSGENTVNSIENTRLSMLHYQLAQQGAFDCNPQKNGNRVETDGGTLASNGPSNLKFVQLLALTPGTSFKLTRGLGTIDERAQMCAIMYQYYRDELHKKGLPFTQYHKDKLILSLKGKRTGLSGFKNKFKEYRKSINKIPNGSYCLYMFNAIEEYKGTSTVIEDLENIIRDFSTNYVPEGKANEIIKKLRIMFAFISAEMLQPDLVIMDEFQRFKSLLQTEENSDTDILAKKFFNDNNTRILLLSATPYKLYSTLEEICMENQEGSDDQGLDGDHYKEFKDVTNFLFANDNGEFDAIWKDYSYQLQQLHTNSIDIFKIAKNKAENMLYKGICRTERISAMDSEDFLRTVLVPVHLKHYDVLSYIQFNELLQDIDIKVNLPIDYVKSCPFLLSFMDNYILKEYIADKIIKEQNYSALDKSLLWLYREDIAQYKELPASNARFECLKEHIFAQGGELLLWVPPSKPYYELQGVYKGKEGFSKILVFSAWAMVPRMLGAMLSYEAERRTIGEANKRAETEGAESRSYFSARRYPSGRLRLSDNTLSVLCLLYPSKTLAGLYDHLQFQKLTNLDDVEARIKDSLMPMLQSLEQFCDPESTREDDKWYYYAPILLDQDWIKCSSLENGRNSWQNWQRCIDDKDEFNSSNKAFVKILDNVFNNNNFKLGKMPKDLLQTLVNMVLGSPAICAYRSDKQDLGRIKRAVEISKVILRNFNSQESTAILDLIYREQDTSTYWKNVLKYCKDGCLQAVLDEYRHILADEAAFAHGEDLAEIIHKIMLESLNIRTATYYIDTQAAFAAYCAQEEESPQSDASEIPIRANFAVGYFEDSREDKKNVLRKTSIRKAFNSPMRPFVLATTSIGQEGLDFHAYCRKVMHWNLPANPIDLEQREGRVNRYKCLAVRQSLAQKYANITFTEDVWKEMFAKALTEKPSGKSDLIPFWCLGKDQQVKIERIVPMYPLSKDGVKYKRLIKILSLYRLTLGQPRQEEVLEYIYRNIEDTDSLKDLYINLCPYEKQLGN